MIDENKINILNIVADMLNLHPQILISVYTNLVDIDEKFSELPETEQKEIYKKLYNETYSLFKREYLIKIFIIDKKFIDDFLNGEVNFDEENFKKARKVYNQIMFDALLVIGLIVLKI